jgi:hypothetical protein
VLFAIARSPPLNVFFTSYSIAQILPLGKSLLHFCPFVLTAEKTRSNLQPGAPTEVSDVRAKGNSLPLFEILRAL